MCEKERVFLLHLAGKLYKSPIIERPAFISLDFNKLMNLALRNNVLYYSIKEVLLDNSCIDPEVNQLLKKSIRYCDEEADKIRLGVKLLEESFDDYILLKTCKGFSRIPDDLDVYIPNFDRALNRLKSIVKMLDYDEKRKEMTTEQLSLILGNNFVISFQEQKGDVFAHVRERIRSGKGRIRKMGADYLAYALLDAIVDNYFIVLEHLGEKIESLEEELLSNPSTKTLQVIHALKRDMVFLRKSVWPLREAISRLERGESTLVSDSIRIYIKDVYDHTIQVIDTIETFRDMVSGMLDIYLSSVSNKMNEVMKVLTIVATIFIPLGFIAGLYGMNFNYMPELTFRWGYPAILIGMGVVGASMLIYFRKKKWL